MRTLKKLEPFVTLTNTFDKEMKEEGKPGPKFTFRLPGKVLEANRNAVVEGNSVTWRFTLAEFVNQKTVDPRDPGSTRVLQLESAMGAAIASFPGARVLCVPRSRFASS